MRKLSLLLVAALSTPALGVLVAVPADAKPPKPRAELVTQKVSASLVADKVTAGAKVKNKGTKKAPVSEATFYLSKDAALDRNDTPLGSAQVKKIKAKKSKPVVATFTVPGTATPGTYHVVVCADAGGAVRERKETNNCKGSKGTVKVTGETTGPLTVSASAGTGGTVAAGAISGGTCAVTTCTFPTSGTGTVTFTPTATAGYRFGAWSGATCTGFTDGAAGAITFTNPTSSKACTATFIKQVTVTYSVLPVQALLVGSVTGAATNGSCTNNALTGGGSCVVDAATGTVTLTATPLVLPFLGWMGDCSGMTNPQVLTNLSADKSCTATF
jgi:CARDB protein